MTKIRSRTDSAGTLPISPDGWEPVVAGRATLRLSSVASRPAVALRLDFDFHGGGGFVVARRPITARVSESYTVRFRLRGAASDVDLELKLADGSGRNVWRRVITPFTPSPRWRHCEIPSRLIEFAWGPAHGGLPADLGAIEFALVAADDHGGKGWLEIADLAIVDDDTGSETVTSASTALPGREAAQALTETGWKPQGEDAAPWLQLDVQRVRTFGGVVVDWDAAAPEHGFRIRTSTTGTRWTTRYETKRAGGARSFIALPDARFRYLRLEPRSASVSARVTLQGFEFSRSPEAYWQHVAATEPRGTFPRWLLREQCLWTPVGTPRSGAQALIDEDGRVEFAPGSAMLEPMLWVNGRLFTWANVEIHQALCEGWMPAASVRWQTAEWSLDISAEATASDRLRLRYRLTNRSDETLTARLFVLVRPFQVSPPWQKHGALGGVRRIRRLGWRDGVLQIDESGWVRALNREATFGGLRAAEGTVFERLSGGRARDLDTPRWGYSIRTDLLGAASSVGGSGQDLDMPRRSDSIRADSQGAASLVGGGGRHLDMPLRGDSIRTVPLAGAAPTLALPRRRGRETGCQVSDPDEYATGVLAFEMKADTGASDEVLLTAAATPEQLADADEPLFDWPGAVLISMLAASGDGMEAIRAAWTATAQVLVTRDGAALQPGPRRYRRSWIRDGAVMSAALLRMNCSDAVGAFIRWYAPHIRADGFVPCCVDASGADPLVEHDSHGEWLALIADHQRFAPDAALLDGLWPSVERTVGCIAGLLDATGLLPVSASHEGYLAQPVHAYWDDAWAVRGLRDIAALARLHERDALAQRCDELQQRIADALFASIAATRASKSLDFIPGSIEWADFDPTATANLLTLLDLPSQLDRAVVEQTYARYLDDWRRKRRSEVDWANYTPYEIRIIGVLVRLGWRDAAQELLRFFLADRRPPAWNQWPEIVWRDARAPGHLGDLPHTWIAAEYVLALQSLFAYASETQDALVLTAGVDANWLAGEGVRVRAMPTTRGVLSYTLRRLDDATLQFDLEPGVAGRIVLRPPRAGTIAAVHVNDGRPVRHDAESVTMDAVAAPLRLRIRTAR